MKGSDWEEVVRSNGSGPAALGQRLWGIEHVSGISAQCKKGPPPRARARARGVPPVDWWQLLLDGVLVPHWIHAYDTKLPATPSSLQYVDPHVEYPCPDSGVVCVVEITAAFWGRYPQAYFDLGALGIKIGQGGEEQ